MAVGFASRVALLGLSLLASACALFPHPFSRGPGDEIGVASWYGMDFHGRRTASGARFDQRGLTAAHPTLPLGTRVKVTNLDNHRSVVVLINDRGPYVDGRVIDVSRGAARHLGMVDTGLARVRVTPLEECAEEESGGAGVTAAGGQPRADRATLESRR